MPVVYKVLGQQAPSATTATALYTVPGSTEAIVSTITVCNRGAAAGTFRLSVRPNGATLANQHYIAYDAPIAAKETQSFSLGVTVDATDVVEVYGSSADFSFNAYGTEITA
jgi:hypothetical protein